MAQAQSLQSVSSYRKAHADLLAKQKRINEQIKLEETQQYAQDLYGEVEPEIDIYTEGWESGLVNPFKESDVPESESYEQLSLFDTEETIQDRTDDEKALEKERALQEAMLTIKHKFGKNAVLKGTNFTEGATAKERNRQIGGHKA